MKIFSIFSKLKNKLFSILLGRNERKTVASINEDIKQLANEKILEEKSSEKNENPRSIDDDIKKLIYCERELEETRVALLSKVLDGISDLKSEYDNRFKRLKESRNFISKEILDKKVNALEEEHEKRLKKLEGNIANCEKELEGVRKAQEPILEEKLAMNGRLEEKIDKIRGIDLLNITDDKLEATAKIMDLKTSGNKIKTMIKEIDESGIEETKEKIEMLYKMGSIDLKDEDLNKELKRLRLMTAILGLLPEKDKKIFNWDEDINQSIISLAEERSRGKLNIEHLMYNVGVLLLKKGAFKSAYYYFSTVLDINEDNKGAWLNKGFASGKLGKIDEEIGCYKEAFKRDNGYERAERNKNNAMRKKWICDKYLFIKEVVKRSNENQFKKE